VLKTLSWILLVPAGLFVVMIPFMLIDGDPSAAMGGVLISGLLGVPGLLLRRSAVTQQRESALQEQMVGFVRTHDAFSINELAAHIGKTPGEAQMLLNRDIARYRLPLVMHRASGRYLRLDRLSTAAQVAEQCQNCGASLGNEIVFAGEQLTCPYCASVVRTHAVQAPGYAQPSWQGQGHGGHNPWGRV
jgi:hypothetical protein